MKTIKEQNVLFIFDDDWACEKWDDHDVYRDGIAKLQGSQAVDFIGIRGENLYLIEVKDFRGHYIENKGKTSEWSNEIAWKIRDTIAAMVGAAVSRPSQDDIIARCVEVIEKHDADKIHVIACIIEDSKKYSLDRRKRKIQLGEERKTSEQWREALRKRLRWLTRKVSHSNPFLEGQDLPGVQVQRLPNSEEMKVDGVPASEKGKLASMIHRIRQLQEESRQRGISLDGAVSRGIDEWIERVKAK